MAETFSKDQVLASLRAWKELRFDDSSRLYAASAGVSAGAADALDTFLRSDETLRYGIPTKDPHRVLAWWLLTDRAVLTVEVNGDLPSSGQVEIATYRYALNSIQRILLIERIQPDGKTPEYALEIALPSRLGPFEHVPGASTLSIESAKLDGKTARSTGVKQFAAELASLLGERT